MTSFQGVTISKGAFAAPIGPGARGPTNSNFTTPDAGSAAARAEFTKAAQPTTAQRLREAELAKLGLTDAALKGMGSDQRRLIEDGVRDQIAQTARAEPLQGLKTGLLADVTA